MGIKNYNITVQEQVHKVRRVQRPVITGADKYTATGETLEQRWTGKWSELETKLGTLDYSVTQRMAATLTRLDDGDFAELAVVWSYYTATGDSSGGTEGGGEGGNVLPGSSREQPSYAVQATVVHEPLLTHPKYADTFDSKTIVAAKLLMDGASDLDVVARTESGDPQTLGELLEFVDEGLVKKLRRGQTHYLAPQIQLSARYRADSMPDISGSMKIASPPGNVPTPSGCNWLKLVPCIDVQGDEIWVSETYLLSAPGGWDADIYS